MKAIRPIIWPAVLVEGVWFRIVIYYLYDHESTGLVTLKTLEDEDDAMSMNNSPGQAESDFCRTVP